MFFSSKYGVLREFNKIANKLNANKKRYKDPSRTFDRIESEATAALTLKYK